MNKFLLYTILLIGISFHACSQKKGTDEINALIEANKSLIEVVIPASKSPGLGSVKGIPSGTAFVLPPCVKIVERPNHPFDPDLKKLHGSMNTFYADVSLVNECPDNVTVEFPAGLVLVSIYEGTQSGLLITKEVITLPPTIRPNSRDKDTTTIYLGMACLNEHKGLPWEENSEEDTKNYPIGKGMHKPAVVTNDKGLQQLLALFANKPKLKVKEHYNPRDGFDDSGDSNFPESMAIYSDIQKAIWKVTDGQGITRGELEKLKTKLEEYK